MLRPFTAEASRVHCQPSHGRAGGEAQLMRRGSAAIPEPRKHGKPTGRIVFVTVLARPLPKP